MNKKTISIAMATYNGGKYILQQLKSLAGQSLLPDELVVADDLSTDNTVEIIKEFAKRAPFRVKLIVNEERLGFVGNFNKALLNARGDFVFLCDQDDYWFENKIEAMISFANENPMHMLYMSDAELATGDLTSIGITIQEQFNKNLGLGDERLIMGCCTLMKREFLDLCMPIPSDFYAHDGWLTNIADALKLKAVNRKTLQLYRRHDENTSDFIGNRTKKASKTVDFMESLKVVFCCKENAEDSAAQHGTDKILAQLKLIKQQSTNELVLNEIDFALAKYAKLVYSFETRINIRKKTFLRRIIPVMRASLSGVYQDKNLFLSAGKDLLEKLKVLP